MRRPPAPGMDVTPGVVVVYAPSPLLTTTVEQHTSEAELHLHAGGQGVWQARMVTRLGGRAVFCTVLGGETGVVLETLLEREGFAVRTVHRAAPSGWYVHDRRRGSRDELAHCSGSALGRHDIDELSNVVLAESLRAPVTVLGGPAHPSLLPPDVYRRLTTDVGRHGGRVVVDLAGAHLAAAVAGRPSVVKISHEEVIADGRAVDDSLEALAAAAARLRAEGAGCVIVSRAGEPALALLDDELMLVEPPPVEPVDPRGAGDSMTAAIAVRLALGDDLADAIRVGAAAGAVNATRHGHGTGYADAIDTLANRVALRPLDGWS